MEEQKKITRRATAEEILERTYLNSAHYNYETREVGLAIIFTDKRMKEVEETLSLREFNKKYMREEQWQKPFH